MKQIHQFIPILFLLFSLKSFAQNEHRHYKSAQKVGENLEVKVSDGSILFTPYAQNSMEVVFTPLGKSNPPANAIAHQPKVVHTQFNDMDYYIEFSTKGIVVKIQKQPFKISYIYHDKPLFSEAEGYFENDSLLGFRMNLSQGEKLMGGGERVLGMDRRGNRLQLYNRASYGYETHAELMYYSMPVVISSNKYMLAFDNGASGFLDLGATETDILQFEAVGGRRSYVLVAADEWTQLATNFTALTGRQPMLPRWALGNIASRFGYHTQREVLEVATEYMEQDIPLDAIVLDLYWFGPDVQGHMGNLEWDLDSFPDPVLMMSELKKKGVKTVLITEPFILTSSKKYEESKALGVLATDSLGKPYQFDFYFGNTALIDIFKPEAKDWFWRVYKKHTLEGVEGWWGDLGEPEVHPDKLMHVNGRANEVHNLYGHEWAKTVYQGFDSDFQDKRPVILMRSGFIGSQRYGLVPWSGDVNRTWGGFKPQVEIALQMGMQGLAFIHSDLGGFAGDYKDSELYIRWLQYGVFQPIYRPHAQEEVPSEPIFWDDETKDIVRRYIKLRYELMPYTYTLAYQNHVSGLPLMRPLVYFDDNPVLLDENELYLWGDNFLIAPITEKGATSKNVYFPKGHVWFDYWNGTKYEGGKSAVVAVDLNNTPVFVKAGSFIPKVDPVQSTDLYSSENLHLDYYYDASVTRSSDIMYDDDGHTPNAYELKKYELLKFESLNEKGKLTIKVSPKGFANEGKPEHRNLKLGIHHLCKPPKVAFVNGRRMKVAKTSKQVLKHGFGAYYNEASNVLYVHTDMRNVALNIEIK